MSIEVFQAEHSGAELLIGIVQSRYNEKLCVGLRKSCLAELKRLGVAEDDVFVYSVPGALELPIALERLAASKHFDALIALGAVVRGETYHFEVVANESAAGINRVSQDFSVPVANGVLTTNTEEQALERVKEKGADAARVAVEMANLVEAINESLHGSEDDGEDDAEDEDFDEDFDEDDLDDDDDDDR
ncbi:MAG: 6,7-dimethyl-8-ribityllumazine synthase [Burkholderiaceae bacterium]